MSEDEDNEELPKIFFNSSASDASRFSMPSAEQVATQRAREQECEEQLRALRSRHAADDVALARADSSGSEGEAALAAAVRHLRVEPPPARAAAPRATELLAALAPLLPAAPCALLQRAPPDLVRAADALAAPYDAALPHDEALAAAALLIVAALAPDARRRPAARRALHALLDHCATPHQVEELGRVMLAGLPEARVRLELSDMLRSGAGGGADALAARVRDAALCALLGASDASMERLCGAAARWRSLAPPDRYTALQLLGRRLGAGGAGGAGGDEREARARLLDALAPAARDHDAHRPDLLKVLVSVSRLRLLFRSDS